MIISSSNIGMESVRKYSSLRMDAYGTVIGSRTSLSLDETLGESNSGVTEGSKKGCFKDTMDSLMNRYGSMRTTRIMPNHFEESAMDRIRTECINFLIRLLFGGSMRS